MGKYILRYTGGGNTPIEDVRQIRAVPSITVLDNSSRMLLVQATETTVRHLLREMTGWVYGPEQTYEIPNPHPKVLRQPKSASKK